MTFIIGVKNLAHFSVLSSILTWKRTLLQLFSGINFFFLLRTQVCENVATFKLTMEYEVAIFFYWDYFTLVEKKKFFLTKKNKRNSNRNKEQGKCLENQQTTNSYKTWWTLKYLRTGPNFTKKFHVFNENNCFNLVWMSSVFLYDYS